MPARSVSFTCLLRHVSSALSRNYRNEPRPDVDEAWFVTVKFMARQLHGLGDVKTEIKDCSRVSWVDDLNAGSESRGTDTDRGKESRSF